MLSSFINTVLSYAQSILPAFGVGIVAAYILERYFHPRILKKLTRRVTVTKVLLIHLLGMISPLSILSFLPIARELTDVGVNPALLFSFFIAERVYDLQSFPILSNLFGVRFAIFNVVAIFLSLLVTTVTVESGTVQFKKTKQKKKKQEGFWIRQAKLLIIVVVGICVGAGLRVIFPPQAQAYVTHSVYGVLSSLVLGFVLYFGPIMGNYPVAKAFADVGMTQTGVFTFLTVAPILNFVVILLLGASVGFKTTIRAVLAYSLVALVLSVIFSIFFL